VAVVFTYAVFFHSRADRLLDVEDRLALFVLSKPSSGQLQEDQQCLFCFRHHRLITRAAMNPSRPGRCSACVRGRLSKAAGSPYENW
jgi:hypothetical protein